MDLIYYEVFNRYYDGTRELIDSGVEHNIKENRKKIVDKWITEDKSTMFLHDLDEFIEGDSVWFSIFIDDEDVDVPIGRDITVLSYQDKLKEIESDYKQKLEDLNKLFNL